MSQIRGREGLPEGGSEGSHLGKYANKCASPGQTPFLTDWDLKRWLWSNSSLAGLWKCDRVRWRPDVEVVVWPGGVGFEGVCRCGSVWACPTCARRIRRARARELSGGLMEWVGDGRGVVFVTLTLPHDQGDGLAALFGSVTKAWHGTTTARAVRAFGEGLPFRFVRALEVTSGLSGWHPHNHVAVLFDRPLDRDEAIGFRDVIYGAWCSAVEREGWRRPGERYGVRVVRVAKVDDAGRVAEYCSKLEGLSDELTRMDTKRAKGKSPFELLRCAVVGDIVSLARWYEFEAASKGRKALNWSKGLRAELKLGAEKSDQELSDPGCELGAVRVGELGPREHDWLIRHPRGFEVFCESLTAEDSYGDLRAAVGALWASMPASVLPVGHPDRPYLMWRESQEIEREMALLGVRVEQQQMEVV